MENNVPRLTVELPGKLTTCVRPPLPPGAPSQDEPCACTSVGAGSVGSQLLGRPPPLGVSARSTLTQTPHVAARERRASTSTRG
jgi:hypothetical protein